MQNKSKILQLQYMLDLWYNREIKATLWPNLCITLCEFLKQSYVKSLGPIVLVQCLSIRNYRIIIMSKSCTTMILESNANHLNLCISLWISEYHLNLSYQQWISVGILVLSMRTYCKPVKIFIYRPPNFMSISAAII